MIIRRSIRGLLPLPCKSAHPVVRALRFTQCDQGYMPQI
jgi:hypothetical protein